ncbi:MAG TPA: sigma 54-interacting transcriptional regulator [Nitrospiria bacterium]|jgi:formate hydrogenlyase transcriptional activator
MFFENENTSKGGETILRKLNLIQSHLNSQVQEKNNQQIPQVFVEALNSVWEDHFWAVALRPEEKGGAWKGHGFQTQLFSEKAIQDFLDQGEFLTKNISGTFSKRPPPPALRHLNLKNLFVFPIVHFERDLGLLILGVFENIDISEEQVTVLETLTRNLGFVLEITRSSRIYHHKNRILKERLSRRVLQVKRILAERNTIFRVLEAGLFQNDLSSMFGKIADAVRKTVPFDEMGLLLPSPDGTDLECFFIHIENKQIHSNSILVIPQTGTSAEWILKNKKSFFMKEIEDLKKFPFCYENCSKNYFQSYCAFPLLNGDKVIGVLNYASRGRDRFPMESIPYMEDLSHTIALVLNNSKNIEREAKNRISLIENVYIQRKMKAESKFKEIIGKSPVIQEVLKRVEMVAGTESSVLITGETGTGKGLLAKAIFQLSSRKNNSLITVDCASLPPGLVESELFGHEKGAFTSAIIRRVGRFELADGGTIFLDEIGELPKEAQAKLLRVLEHRKFERVGGTRTISINVRVIAATNRNLSKVTEDDSFRADLFYRLNVFPINLPPLRERREDIPMLAYYFIKKYSDIMNKKIIDVDKETMNKLVSYPWPGNVRELEHMIERAVILCAGSVLEINEEVLSSPEPSDPKGKAVEAFNAGEGKKIGKDGDFLKVLDQVGGKRSKAAQLLGISRTTLWRKLKDHNAPIILLSVICL